MYIALGDEIKQPHDVMAPERERGGDSAPNRETQDLALDEAQSPYKADVWRRLSPRERLHRSWQMRSRLRDLKAVHDRKLFPKPE